MYVIDEEIETLPYMDNEEAGVTQQAPNFEDDEEDPTEHSDWAVGRHRVREQNRSVSFREVVDLVDFDMEGDTLDEIPNIGHMYEWSDEQDEVGLIYCGCCRSKPKRPFFNRWYNVVLAFVGWAIVCLDLITDITMIVLFFGNGQWIYGGVTLTIACVFYLFAACFFRYNWLWSTKTWPPWLKWVFGFQMAVLGPFIMPLLQVGLQVMHCFKLCSPSLSRRERKAVEHSTRTVVGAGVLYRLVQVFMQSAPQLLWQLYILLLNSKSLDLFHSPAGRVQAVSILSSLLNLVLVQAAFKDVNQIYRGNRKPQSRPAQYFNFLWRLAQTSGRVLSIVLFATQFLLEAVALLLSHWLLMSVWYVKKLSPSDHPRRKRVLIGVTSGFCSVFSHFVYAKVKPSRYWHLVLGALFLVENGLMLGLWFAYTPDRGTWVHMGGFIMALVCVPVQVVVQLIYFKCCHRSYRRIPARTTCSCRVWERMLCRSEWNATELTYDEIEFYQ